MDTWIHRYLTVTWKNIKNNMGQQFKLIIIKNNWINIPKHKLSQKILVLIHVININKINAKHKIGKY